MHIDFLAEHLEQVPTLAEWLHGEWGPASGGATLEGWTEELQRRTHRDRLPLAWVALSGSAPIGTASLVERDLPGREDLAPWLASLFVPEELRRQGIGTALVRRAVAGAAELGVERLHIYTFSHQDFYAALGWELVGREDLAGRRASVLAISPAAAAG